MSKKILINGITLENGNIIPLLLKIKKWQSLGAQITIFSNLYLKNKVDGLNMIGKYDFIELRGTNEIKGKSQFIFEALKRNFIALFYVRKIKKQKFDAVYSISSVLDLILFPYALKIVDRKIKWLAVFDNTVPLISNGELISGNKLIRLLAWFFYKISLFFLKSIDYLFVIKPELRKYMLNHGFFDSQLVVTGNGVEKDFIEKARVFDKYKIDALFIGRINEAKGIYDMLEVVSIVKKKYNNFQLAIMGKGDEMTENKFKKRIKKIDLESNIQFLGYCIGQEKFDIIKSSKFFLFLSETESVPIAPLEAVCSGLKTLVYDLDAYNMYKNNEVIIFKKNDYKAVAEKILNMMETNDFENKKGKLLLNNYSWDEIAKIEFNKLN